MSETQFSGPLVISGDGFSTGNADAAPSLVWGGVGLVDPRVAYRPGAGSAVIYGFAPGNELLALDQVPSAIATTNIAAAQTTTSGTKLVLVSSTGAGITVTTTATTIPQTGNVVPSGALAIDGVPGVVAFGTSGKIVIADPTKAIARAVSVTAQASAAGGALTVVGYDLYGNLQTEKITAVANTTVNGKRDLSLSFPLPLLSRMPPTRIPLGLQTSMSSLFALIVSRMPPLAGITPSSLHQPASLPPLPQRLPTQPAAFAELMLSSRHQTARRLCRCLLAFRQRI